MAQQSALDPSSIYNARRIWNGMSSQNLRKAQNSASQRYHDGPEQEPNGHIPCVKDME
jgi:hypothetical protein